MLEIIRNSKSLENDFFSIRALRRAPIILSLIPPLIVFLLINKHGVNFPYWDQWGLVDILQKAHTSATSIGFKDLIQQHNEHRILIPRIVIILLSYLSSSWNIRNEIFFSYLIAWLLFFMTIFLSRISIFVLERETDNLSIPRLETFAVIVSSVLIFSATQYENWLWGFQIAWFLIILFIFAAILSLTFFNKTRKLSYYFLAYGFCMLSSYSSAHGLFSWITCAPLFLTRRLSRKQKISSFGIWLFSFILVSALYSWGYEKPAHHPPLTTLFTNFSGSLDYFLNLLGGSFIGHDLSTEAGILLLACYLIFFCKVFLNKTSEICRESSLPWLSLGLFPIIFSAITMVGRAGFGSHQALASRYTTVSLLLPLALLNLWILWSQNASNNNDSARSRTGYTYLLFFLIGCLTPSFIQSNIEGLQRGEISAFDRYRGQACVELSDHLEPDFAQACTSQVHPDLNYLVDKYGILRSSGLLKAPPDFSLEDGRNFSESIQGRLESSENLTDFPENPTQVTEFHGWGHDTLAPSDRKSVIFLKSSSSDRFFAVGNIKQKRKDVAEAFDDSSYLSSGWTIQVPSENMPSETSIITAYMYNTSNKTLSKLDGETQYVPQQTG
ncbi:MAG: hypothetical protein F6K42_17065 [Leptolyngbya sp. SIO1D8]|nr:hypothetical protein [Leptolyngbya sp. SIO1D8]